MSMLDRLFGQKKKGKKQWERTPSPPPPLPPIRFSVMVTYGVPEMTGWAKQTAACLRIAPGHPLCYGSRKVVESLKEEFQFEVPGEYADERVEVWNALYRPIEGMNRQLTVFRADIMHLEPKAYAWVIGEDDHCKHWVLR